MSITGFIQRNCSKLDHFFDRLGRRNFLYLNQIARLALTGYFKINHSYNITSFTNGIYTVNLAIPLQDRLEINTDTYNSETWSNKGDLLFLCADDKLLKLIAC